MEPTDLAFFTTEELLAELTRRKTFLGVIVHAEEEHRGAWSHGVKMFKLRHSDSLDQASATRLIDAVAEYIDLH